MIKLFEAFFNYVVWGLISFPHLFFLLSIDLFSSVSPYKYILYTFIVLKTLVPYDITYIIRQYSITYILFLAAVLFNSFLNTSQSTSRICKFIVKFGKTIGSNLKKEMKRRWAFLKTSIKRSDFRGCYS